jgi:two-component system, sensor histidine kinase ChiS
MIPEFLDIFIKIESVPGGARARLSALMLLALFTVAEAQQVNFRHLTIDDGLSQNAVYAIHQDRLGFLWFATKDGLNRYDGRRFVVYQHNPFDPTTLSDAYITQVFEDSRGRLWTGSFAGHINVRQPASDDFCNVTLRDPNGNILITHEITALAEDATGSIWIGTRGSGLFRIVPQATTGCAYQHQQFVHDPADARSISSNQIANLLVDQQSVLWVGTEIGLNQYAAASGTFLRTRFDTKHPDATPMDGAWKISALHETRTGEFWVGTQSGLVRFDRATGAYTNYPNQFEVFRYGWGSVNAIAEDDAQNFWLATAAGLMHFNTQTLTYSYFQHNPLDVRSLSHNILSSMLLDNAGNLWLGTSGLGINILDTKANRFKKLVRTPNPDSRITGFSVRAIHEDRSGQVWISADVLYRWDRETGTLTSYETTSERPDDFGNTETYSIIEASDGILWFASTQGLFRYDPETRRYRLYKHDPDQPDGLRAREVHVVFEDRDQNIWVANHNHISRLTDPERGTFTHIPFKHNDQFRGLARPVLLQDVHGMIWIGVTDGLYRLNPSDGTIHAYHNDPGNPRTISNNHIKSLLADPEHPETTLWVGTNGGLNKLHYPSGVFEHITTRDGLPNDVVYGILPDTDGYLWLSTNRGLSRYHPDHGTFRNFDVFDGLQSNEFNTGAYFRNSRGELFFGGIQGLNYFQPSEIRDNPQPPPVVLTGLRVGNRPLITRTDPERIPVVVPALTQVTFTHREDVITFDFAALDYSAPAKNAYRYTLEGYNNDWIDAGTNASATYTNLPPGTYTFRAQGSNNDGIWNQEGLALAVTVLPPWWRTYWAYSGYALLLFGFLFGARRYDLDRIRLKNQLALERVETESLRHLDQLKSHFFANISHEFRTPLTLITGQIETLLDAEGDANRRQKLAAVNQQAEQLLGLINQLLDLSKLEAGKMDLDKRPHNLVTFLKNQLFSFESLAASRDIILNFTSDRTTIAMHYDAEKFETVCMNLISNAIKFTHPSGRVDVSVEIADMQTIQIRVRDTGIGIAPDRLPYIFDRFYQADPSNTRLYGGTGIGLALVHELVGLHGGTITAQSTVGAGTTFTLQFPFEEHANEAATEGSVDAAAGQSSSDGALTTSPEDTPEGQVSAAEPTSASAMKAANNGGAAFGIQLSEHDEIILIVEDNPNVRLFIREQLQRSYKILEATNGETGLNISRQTIPDLIITDLMMPQLDGYTFCKAIRQDERTSHIPVIMLTARAGLDAKLEGLQSGVDAYLNKPFHVKELKTTVHNLLAQRKALKKRFSGATNFATAVESSRAPDQEFLNRALQVVEAHLREENFQVEDFAAVMTMSASQLNRKLNGLIGQPAGNFIRMVRLQRSAEMLLHSDKTISEICFETGFSDQAYFSRAFKKQFGKNPSAYRKVRN